jgi:hypothetical protein
MDRSGNKQQIDDSYVLGLLQQVDVHDGVGVS